MSCKCIANVNKLLNERDEELGVSISLSTGKVRTILETRSVAGKKRRKRTHLVACYCPFCGKDYESKKAAVG